MSGLVVNSADLKDIQVALLNYPFNRDTGLELVGFVGSSKDRVRGMIAMGPEAATVKFAEEVKEAINKVKPPVKKGMSNWFRGV